MQLSLAFVGGVFLVLCTATVYNASFATFAFATFANEFAPLNVSTWHSRTYSSNDQRGLVTEASVGRANEFVLDTHSCDTNTI